MADQDPQGPKKPDWEHVQWHLKEPSPEDDKPENPLVRWVILVVFTLIGALGLGVLFAVMPYFASSSSSTRYRRSQFAQTDTMSDFKWRFVIGFILGLPVAFVWLWRITRKSDD